MLIKKHAVQFYELHTARQELLFEIMIQKLMTIHFTSLLC